MNRQISEEDKLFLQKIRINVKQFIQDAANTFDEKGLKILDIAPQDYLGAKEFFSKSKIFTLDIDPNSGADYIADICNDNSQIIPSNFFDIIICTEVLEHTLQPFNATKELYRILKPEGQVYCSTPFNFRIHGPLPDCWRFTEHGLRSLFSAYSSVNIKELEHEDRFLMPIHYTTIAMK